MAESSVSVKVRTRIRPRWAMPLMRLGAKVGGAGERLIECGARALRVDMKLDDGDWTRLAVLDPELLLERIRADE